MNDKVKSKVRIRHNVPYGGIKTIAKLSQRSIFTVSRVLNGTSKNEEVIDALLQYTKEEKQKKEKRKAVIEELNTI